MSDDEHDFDPDSPVARKLFETVAPAIREAADEGMPTRNIVCLLLASACGFAGAAGQNRAWVVSELIRYVEVADELETRLGKRTGRTH